MEGGEVYDREVYDSTEVYDCNAEQMFFVIFFLQNKISFFEKILFLYLGPLLINLLTLLTSTISTPDPNNFILIDFLFKSFNNIF